MISSLIVGREEIVSLLRRFWTLTKGAAAGFGGGLGGLKRTPWPPGAIELDGAKGFMGVVEGPSLGSGGRAGSDIDGSLLEDAISDKVHGVKSLQKFRKFQKFRIEGKRSMPSLLAVFLFFLFYYICFLFWVNTGTCSS
jgi:hypothetical protein